MKTAIATAAAAAMLSTMANAQAFILKTRSTGQYDNDKTLVAWNGMFIAENPGNSTTATCPPWAANCPGKDTTILSGPTLGGSPTQLWMGVLQEHGQRVYLHEPPKGLFESQNYGDLISYTAAGTSESANVPLVDNYEDLFNIVKFDASSGSYGAKDGELVLAHGADNSTSFNICSSYNNPWGGETGILSTVGKFCTPINVVIEYTTVDAPQYYNCDGCELRGDLAKNGPACQPPFCGSRNRFWWI
ncbi:hypothetical protein E4T39_00344 [Aureobasidium subglaciale]|nr:hypothetical protein E4T39_00344 [Aureobasidium subglaciale]